MKQINLRLSEETLAGVDEQRGRVPRNAWLVDLIEQRVALGESDRPFMQATVRTPPDDPACPLGWKPRPGTARCFNCGRSRSRHAQTAPVEF